MEKEVVVVPENGAATAPREVKAGRIWGTLRNAGRLISSVLEGLPALSRAGAPLLVAGLLMDLLAHLGPWRQFPVATGAHLLVLAGAVLSMVGAILVGIRRGGMRKVGRFS